MPEPEIQELLDNDKQLKWLVDVCGASGVNKALETEWTGVGDGFMGDYTQFRSGLKQKEDRLDGMRGDIDQFKYDLQDMMRIQLKAKSKLAKSDEGWFKRGKLSLLSDPDAEKWGNQFEVDTGAVEIDEALGMGEVRGKRITEQLDKLMEMEHRMAGEILAKDWPKIAERAGDPNPESLDTIAADYWVSAETIQKVIDAHNQHSLDTKICDPNPAFSAEEIRQELYQPLMREAIIPDNFVPDKYNETVTQFFGASDLYQEGLQAYTAELGKDGERLARIESAQFYMSKGKDIVKNISTLR